MAEQSKTQKSCEVVFMFPNNIVEIVNKASPFIANLLGSPVGGVVGNIVSTVLGGANMGDPESLARSLGVPGAIDKLRELELQLKDLQNARLFAQKESSKWIRPFLALLAMLAVFADIVAIQYVTDKMLNEILIMMLVFLVWDIRQIYTFYFGKSGDLPEMPFVKRK